MDIESIKAQHILLERWDYTWTPLSKGYTDKVLYINVGTREIKDKNVPLPRKKNSLVVKDMASGYSGMAQSLILNGMTLIMRLLFHQVRLVA